MSLPKVSVLMAVFNTEAYVGDAIASIRSQTLSEIEVIVVDDGSTDGSWSAVAAAASQDSRIVALRRESQGGASRALNQALARARGTYITRQDSDDLSLPTRLADQVHFLEGHPEVGAAGTQVTVTDQAGTPLRVSGFPEADADIQSALLDRMCFCGPTVMARKAVIDAVAFRFDESLSGTEDYDFCLRLAEVTRLANLSQPLYRYRRHATSVSSSQRCDQLLKKATALERAIHRRFGPDPPAGRLTDVARDYFRAAVVGHATGDSRRVQDCLARALAVGPELLDDAPRVGEIVARYTPREPMARALAFVDSLFEEVLPRTSRLARVRRELIAGLHVQRAFGAGGGGGRSDAKGHLRAAVRANPALLVNGSFLIRLVRHGLGRRKPAEPDTGVSAHTPSSS